MPLTILVNNQPPSSDNEVPQPLLDLFQKCLNGRYPPSPDSPPMNQFPLQQGMSYEPGDLLFSFYPLGGLVIISDLIASYRHEQVKDYQALFGQASSLGEVFESPIAHADEIEEGVTRYDLRDYSLREMLKLSTGERRATWTKVEV